MALLLIHKIIIHNLKSDDHIIVNNIINVIKWLNHDKMDNIRCFT